MNTIKFVYGLIHPLGIMARFTLWGGGSGGGGSPAPTQNTTYTTNIPEYAQPYVETMLGTAQQQTYNYNDQGQPTGMKPYTPYSQDPNAYIAGFSPMQQQAFQGAANMGVTPETGMAAGMAGAAGMGAMNTNYQAGQFNPNQVQAPNLQNYQMQGPQNVQTQSFANPYSAQAYMSPYMQNVVGIQQREAQRAADVAKTGRNAQAVGAGAFGGSRQAIMDAEAERNLATQKGDIQAQGLQSAYGQAQGQFNAEQQARLQAQMANQQAGINVGGQNLNALLGVQQLGAGQNLQSQLANQQAGMAAQQAAEQSRQYGANLGLQGLQTGVQAAGQLGQLGQNVYGQQMGINQLQNQYGAQQQGLEQSKINQQIQNYATQQQYPMMQLANMSSLLRGLPMQSTTVQGYQAAPSAISQLGGLGTAGIAGLGLYNTMNKA